MEDEVETIEGLTAPGILGSQEEADAHYEEPEG